MAFTSVEQIRNKFLKDGWSKDISFEELSLKEAENKGYLFALDGISKGRKYFKMKANGNIYNEQGKIVLYNITPKLNSLN